MFVELFEENGLTGSSERIVGAHTSYPSASAYQKFRRHKDPMAVFSVRVQQCDPDVC